ncbi:MAG: hypothetical protein NVS1B6_20340 [Steroidobacteraceae bacterium]
MAIEPAIINVSGDVLPKCPNCDANIVLRQQYCGFCGQKYTSGRLTLHDIGHDLLHVFIHVDRSALSLVRMLLVRPGAIAQDYVQGKRKRYFGPFAFLFVVVAAASAAISLTGFRAVFTSDPNAVADFVQNHLNLVMFAEVPLLAAFSRLIDRRSCFNFAEHLVLAAYTSGMRIIFATLFVICAWYVLRLSNATSSYWDFAYLPLWPLYFGFAASQFLPGSRVVSWCKGILAAMLTWGLTQGLAALAASLFFRSIATVE